MSSRHLPRVIGQRGKSHAEVERENFEKSQVNLTPQLFNLKF